MQTSYLYFTAMNYLGATEHTGLHEQVAVWLSGACWNGLDPSGATYRFT